MDDVVVALFLLALAAVVGLLPIVSLIAGLSARSRTMRLQAEVHELGARLIGAERELGALKERGPVKAVATEPVAPEPIATKPAASAPMATEPEAPEPIATEPEAPEPLATEPVATEPAATEPTGTGRVIPRPPAPRPTAPARAPLSLEHLGTWLFAALGGVFLLVGGLLFFAYALDEGWFARITPGMRFAMGIGVGLGALLISELLHRRKYMVPSAGLGGAGVGVLYGALYAGHSLYELVDQAPTFALMSGVTAVSVLLAWRRDSRFIALLGLVGGLLTPVLLSTGNNRAVALFSYLLLLNLGVGWVSVKRDWPSILGLTAVGTWILHLGWGLTYAVGDPSQVPVAMAAMLLLSGVYLLAAMWKDSGPLLRIVAIIMALAPPMLALPVVVEPDLLVFGPAGKSLLVDLDARMWLIPGALALWGGAISEISARRGWPLATGAAVAGLVIPQLVLIAQLASQASVADVSSHPALDLALAMLALPLLAVLAPILLRRAEPAGAELVIPGALMSLGVLAAVLVSVPLPGVAALCAVGIAVVGLVGSRHSTASTMAALGAAALPLYVLWEHFDEGTALHQLVPAVLAVVLLVSAAPILRKEPDARLIPWLASALAPIVMYAPLHYAWEERLGVSFIGLLPIALGALSLFSGAYLRRAAAARPSEPRLVAFVIVATLFACGAVPVQLDGQWVTLAWAMEAVVLCWLAPRILPSLRAFALVLFALVGGRLLMEPWVIELPAPDVNLLLNPMLLTWGVVSACLLVCARLLDDQEPLAAPWPKLLRTAAVVTLFVLLNLELGLIYAEEGFPKLTGGSISQEMIRSLCWGVFGGVLLGLGVGRDSQGTRLLGMGVLLVAAAKVFFLDLWALAGMWRVGSVLGAAVTLIAAAVLLQRVVLRQPPPADGDPQ